MNKTYSLEEHPTFKDGETVRVDLSRTHAELSIEIGKIVGKATQGLLDVWMVEFEHDFAPTYPYKVVAISHTFIIKN